MEGNLYSLSINLLVLVYNNQGTSSMLSQSIKPVHFTEEELRFRER